MERKPDKVLGWKMRWFKPVLSTDPKIKIKHTRIRKPIHQLSRSQLKLLEKERREHVKKMQHVNSEMGKLICTCVQEKSHDESEHGLAVRSKLPCNTDSTPGDEGPSNTHFEPRSPQRSNSEVDGASTSSMRGSPTSINSIASPNHQADVDSTNSEEDSEDEYDDSFSDCSSIEDDETVESVESFRELLTACFVENKISLKAIDNILTVMRMHRCFTNLPKCARTLLKTPRRPVQLTPVAPGWYLHFGVHAAIVSILNGVEMSSIPDNLEIDFSTDGASPDKSGSNQMWPIQCRVSNMYPSSTEVIGVYRGNGKPNSVGEFFNEFIEETLAIIAEGGIIFCDKKIPITLRCFIADAPARAYVLNHKAHTSYQPCSKCKIIGEYVDNRMAYKSIQNELRTDEEYIRMVDEDHHNGESPLSRLPLGLVTQVPFEYMHLVCLGLKRMLSAWVLGKFSNESRLSARLISLLSKRLKLLRDWYPREMARWPITLEEFLQMKAAQLRQFLFYNGPVVLYGILSKDLYDHFLLLHAAMRALSNPSATEILLEFAKLALILFVEHSPNLYGLFFMSYNIHGLLHIVEDVKRFGPPDNYSAFPYESNMKIFKQFCRKPHLPLQQIANRRAERANVLASSKRKTSVRVETLQSHTTGPLPANVRELRNVYQYLRLKSPKFTLTTLQRDSCVILKNDHVGLVRNIVVIEGVIHLVLQKFSTVEPFYDVGVSSMAVGFFKCSALQDELLLTTFDEVNSKGYIMPYWDPRGIDLPEEQPVAGQYVVGSLSNTVYY